MLRSGRQPRTREGSIPFLYNKKMHKRYYYGLCKIIMAGVEGIEPSSGVLETLILPMNYTPSNDTISFYIFFAYMSMISNFFVCFFYQF